MKRLTLSGDGDHEGSAVLHNGVVAGIEEDAGDVVSLLDRILGLSLLGDNLVYVEFKVSYSSSRNIFFPPKQSVDGVC